MTQERQLPLGTVLPSEPHGTVVSLPTMSDVDGYERHLPAVREKIKAGYPRFVLNTLVAEVCDQAASQVGFDRTRSVALHSVRAAHQAVALGFPTTHRLHNFKSWALLEVDAPSLERVNKIVQHAGLRLASRAAEAWLANRQENAADALTAISTFLLPWIKPATVDDFRITPSGMNAVAAAMDAARSVQRIRGRTAWLQLGWLYVDSSELLRKTLAVDETLTVIEDVTDTAAIERFFAAHRGKVAAVLTELPNNPQLASPNLDHLSALAVKEGALRILDPSSSGLVNVDLMPHADLLVTSLTKYSGARGDVMAGLVVVHPRTPACQELREAVFSWVGPVAAGDAQVLAEQLPEMVEVATAQNQNAAMIAEFLEKHPAVKRVLTAERGATAGAYAKVARGPHRPGALITFDLKGDLGTFYDAVLLPKGPSFGLRFTLLCPFLWLAHYDLVTTEEGRERIRKANLDPDLIRLSVGTEPPEVIIAALKAALDKKG